TDDDARPGVGFTLGEVRGDARSSLADEDAVHPRRARFDAATEAGGAELEAGVEPAVQFVESRLAAALGVADEDVQFLAGFGVGVLGQPGPCGGEDVGGSCRSHHSAATIRASRALIRGSASRPASRTSRWLSGVAWMPAAR